MCRRAPGDPCDPGRACSASPLTCLAGTHASTWAAMSTFLYCFPRARDDHRHYGDVLRTADDDHLLPAWRFVARRARRVRENQRAPFPALPARPNRAVRIMLTKNPIFLDRHQAYRGDLWAKEAIRWGLTGPLCAGPGPIMMSARRTLTPAMSSTNSSTHRHRGRCQRPLPGHMAEMYQSIRIVQQALDKLPIRPVRSNNRKFVPPRAPRSA